MPGSLPTRWVPCRAGVPRSGCGHWGLGLQPLEPLHEGAGSAGSGGVALGENGPVLPPSGRCRVRVIREEEEDDVIYMFALWTFLLWETFGLLVLSGRPVLPSPLSAPAAGRGEWGHSPGLRAGLDSRWKLKRTLVPALLLHHPCETTLSSGALCSPRVLLAPVVVVSILNQKWSRQRWCSNLYFRNVFFFWMKNHHLLLSIEKV